VPAWAAALTVVPCSPAAMPGAELVFSALDADVAGEVEAAFRDAGVAVFSNARNYRMAPDVPLVVPPVNGGHLQLVRAQASWAATGGFIVTNANCSTTGLVIVRSPAAAAPWRRFISTLLLPCNSARSSRPPPPQALKPLQDAFGIEHATVATMQAISGAGYPGLPSLDILDNVVPFISGEEEKLESEYRKILGQFEGGSGGGAAAAIAPAAFPLTAMVHRVHVRDGHCIAVSLKLARPASAAEVAAALRGWAPADGALARLPSAPPGGYLALREERDRPQPQLDRGAGGGFTTVVGRVRACALNTVKLFVVSHNTVMGAAGSSILNAELAHAQGLLQPQPGRGAPPAAEPAGTTAA